ncbi:hypothetical protein HNQ49_003359 [Parapusillimonas granuli]|nr:hypothetical protein [Parapusillimonas granuli]
MAKNDDGMHEVFAPQKFLPEARREQDARSAAQDTALMRAFGLAHHWQRLLDEQRAASMAEIAEAEGMDVTQVRRVIRLTLLAPCTIERLASSAAVSLDAVLRCEKRGLTGESADIQAGFSAWLVAGRAAQPRLFSGASSTPETGIEPAAVILTKSAPIYTHSRKCGRHAANGVLYRRTNCGE